MKKILILILPLLFLSADGRGQALSVSPKKNPKDIYTLVLHQTIQYLPPNRSYLDMQDIWSQENAQKIKKILSDPKAYFFIENLSIPSKQNAAPEEKYTTDRKFLMRYKRLNNCLQSNWIFCSYIISGNIDLSALTYAQTDKLERFFSIRSGAQKKPYYSTNHNGQPAFIVPIDKEISLQILPKIREIRIIPTPVF